MNVITFLKAHLLYTAAIPILLLCAAMCIFSRKRRVRRQYEEMTQIKRRDEALNEALRNPQVQQKREAEGPMEISWDDKAVRKNGGEGKSIMVELVELSTYSRRKYVYRVDTPVRVGSGKDCQMELLREGVAREHCEFFLLNGQVCVRSLSGARTLLKRGKESALISADGVYLKNDDHIQLGSAEIQFRMFKT